MTIILSEQQHEEGLAISERIRAFAAEVKGDQPVVRLVLDSRTRSFNMRTTRFHESDEHRVEGRQSSRRIFHSSHPFAQGGRCPAKAAHARRHPIRRGYLKDSARSLLRRVATGFRNAPGMASQGSPRRGLRSSLA